MTQRPPPHNARKPAETQCTGRDIKRRADASRRYGNDDVEMGAYENSDTRDGTSEYRSTRCKPVRRNLGHVDHLHTIPVDTSQTPRLPPWEISQRGPPEH